MDITRLVLFGVCSGILLASPAAEAGDRGEQLFEGCIPCHGEDASGAEHLGAPPLAGQEDWYIESQLKKFKTGLRGGVAGDTDGLRMRPMAMMLKDEEEIQLVAAYLSGLPAAKSESASLGGDAAKGAPLYAVCTACHGPDAAGNKAMNAPSLQGLPEWYIAAQLTKFKAGIRGDASDPIAMPMAAMAATLADEQAVKDVTAHITTLGK